MMNARLALAVVVSLSLSGCGFFQREEQVAPPPEPVCPEVEVPLCPEPTVVEKVVVKTVPAPMPPMATTAGKLHLPIIGAVEWARVEPSGLLLEARIDTGAETTSLHADNIQLVERDGKRFVAFELANPDGGDKVSLEQRLKRKVRIKRPGEESERRYVVELWITLGKHTARVETSLSDREGFEYPLSIGRNFLTDAMIVDVSRHHLLQKPVAAE
jgi:hypothetical protein